MGGILTERIKLTEEDFLIMEPDEYFWTEGNVLSFQKSFPEDNIKLNQLKQQILDDYEIVERLKDFFENGDATDAKECYQFLRWDIQSMLGEQK